MKLCFATNNAHKLREVRQLLGDSFEMMGLEDIGCYEELREDRDTIEGNSLQKAEYVSTRYAIHCFADDTGLEVEALEGAPGVYSAGYAGPQKNSEDNIKLLLSNLAGKPNRKARFRTVITLMGKGRVNQFQGIVNGVIVEKESGTGGFGYDPIFLPEGHTKTMGEMTFEEKNAISHRAKALEKLVNYLKAE